MDRFAKAGVQVLSLHESWTEAAGELRDLLLAIVGWVARFESARRSERTKAGIERARSPGKALGRRTGSKTSGGGSGRATSLAGSDQASRSELVSGR